MAKEYQAKPQARDVPEVDEAPPFPSEDRVIEGSAASIPVPPLSRAPRLGRRVYVFIRET